MNNQDIIRRILREEFNISEDYSSHNTANRNQQKNDNNTEKKFEDILTDKSNTKDIDQISTVYKDLRSLYDSALKGGSFSGILRQAGIMGDGEDDATLSAYRKAVLNLGSDGKAGDPARLALPVAKKILQAMQKVAIKS